MLSLIVLISAISLRAAEMPPASQSTPQHEWLQKFVGEWETTSECKMTGEAAVCHGSFKGRMLGGLWLVGEIDTEMPGTGARVQALQTFGFNEKSKQYVGHWVDSMFNHQWSYVGSVDESGKILTMEAEGPDMMGGSGTVQYRDTYEFVSANELKMSSAAKQGDEWVTFMEAKSVRKQ
jgi:hypothetical protein